LVQGQPIDAAHTKAHTVAAAGVDCHDALLHSIVTNSLMAAEMVHIFSFDPSFSF
jgi:hypothetical protein